MGSLSASSFSGQLRNLQSPLPASSSLTFMQHLLCASHSPRALQAFISSPQLSYPHYPDPAPGKWPSGFYPATRPQHPCPSSGPPGTLPPHGPLTRPQGSPFLLHPPLQGVHGQCNGCAVLPEHNCPHISRSASLLLSTAGTACQGKGVEG